VVPVLDDPVLTKGCHEMPAAKGREAIVPRQHRLRRPLRVTRPARSGRAVPQAAGVPRTIAALLADPRTDDDSPTDPATSNNAMSHLGSAPIARVSVHADAIPGPASQRIRPTGN
jgi:hypothetical protein